MMKFSRFVFITAVSFFLFSCASTPKSGAPSSQDTNSDTEIQKDQPSEEKPHEQSVLADINQESDLKKDVSEEKDVSAESESDLPEDSEADSRDTNETEIILEKLDEEEYILNKEPDDSTAEKNTETISEPKIIELSNAQKSNAPTVLKGAEVQVPDGKSTQTQAGIRKSLASGNAQNQSEVMEESFASDKNTENSRSEGTKDAGKPVSEGSEASGAAAEAKNQPQAEANAQNAKASQNGTDKTGIAESAPNSSETEIIKEESVPQQDGATESESSKELTDSELEEFKQPVVIVPSRAVTVKKNQYLDITYPGTGWVYIGETEKTPLFRYFGRKISSDNTGFTLRSITSGSTLLHFYKNDALTGKYIDDYLQVFVTEESATSSARVTAPSYAEVVPAKPVRRSTVIEAEKQAEPTKTEAETSKSAPQKNAESVAEKKSDTTPHTQKTPEAENNIKTVIQTTSSKEESEKQSSGGTISASASAPTSESPASKETEVAADENLLDLAQKAYQDKKYQDALNYAQQYLSFASTRVDEALFLLGQIYESDSSVKNIRNAIDSYESVVKRFPMSKYWKKANNRTIYLKRFYIDIR